jgi:hypothetical protein
MHYMLSILINYIVLFNYNNGRTLQINPELTQPTIDPAHSSLWPKKNRS